MFRRIPPYALILLLLILPGAQAKKGKGVKDSLSGKFEQISQAEMELQEVPYAPGAPAVVLFEGEHLYYAKPATGAWVTRTTYHRRVKILDEGGVDEYGDFSRSFGRKIEDLVVRARTVLPDGTEIDAAENIHRDRSTFRSLSLRSRSEPYWRSLSSGISRRYTRSNGRSRRGSRCWSACSSTLLQSSCASIRHTP